MRLTTLAEPMLEFGTGTHICPRTGIEHMGVYDKRDGSVAKIVKLEHAWRRLDGRNDDGFQVAPFPG